MENNTESFIAFRRATATLYRLLILACLFLFSLNSFAIDWPQELDGEGGRMIVYQPQPEKLEGNVLSGRAAMQLQVDGRDEPVFGVLWFDAKIDTDTDSDMVTISGFTVTNARWPESKDAGVQQFIAAAQAALPGAGFETSIAQLSASLKSAEIEQQSLAELKSEAPQILFSEELAVLLLYDGDPRFFAVEDSDYERALNTPFVVVRQKGAKTVYLSGGTSWYQADNPMGPWVPTTSPPQDLVSMLPEPDDTQDAPETPPTIVAASTPTELIVTQGAPDWQTLPGGQLLYVQNTENAWLRELSTGNMYVLLSGRWFRSKSQDGPWIFVRADELPASFSDIPPDSDIGGIRVSVAGTQEAEDALLDAQIPQTAAIKKDEASLDVEYDGEPKFEKIEGTAVSYGVNTGAQVLEIDSRFYAVDNGVWFTSAAATGPWVVADSVPDDEIQKIPPSSPVYNTTHVHIYESTTEIVYVGYTPGYLWSFPYYGVPVYGTGWYYPPYWGRYYYPRPPTWGLHVGYNPWTGWNFGVSWGNGFFRVGVMWGGGYGGYHPGRCCGGFYGGGYRGPVFINTGDINIGNDINVGNRRDSRDRIDRDIARDGGRDSERPRKNIYDQPENRGRNADRATAQRDLHEARPAPDRSNDVFADRNGNVARKTNDGWQSRENNQWQSNSGLSSAGGGNYDRSGLDRSYQARQHGMNRTAARPQTMHRGGRRR